MQLFAKEKISRRQIRIKKSGWNMERKDNETKSAISEGKLK
jgi:hypothetical protein